MYEAMKDCGASTLEIESFLAEINSLQNKDEQFTSQH
jgi:hypothetical protein